jgi:hypothetical protein
MDTRVDEDPIEHSIELLRSLIRLSPADSRNRLRLLVLLHANDRRHDFVIEAHQYRANCDFTFDTDWDYVCQMGREIVPNIEFFGRTPQKNHQQPNHQRPSGSRSAACTDTGQKEAPSAQTPERQAKQEIPAPESRNDSSNRCDSVKRRMEDRRTCISTWYGEERRTYPRRQNIRRHADTNSRRRH